MIVMPSNCTGAYMASLVSQYPGALAHLYGPEPGGWRRTLPLPYALDNGRYGAWDKGRAWNEAAFWRLCDRAANDSTPPRWVVVPDVVGNRVATLREWDAWAPRLRKTYGWPLALAVQDGMTPDDAIATGADVVFIGGTTRWKWAALPRFAARCPRVHLGRCNAVRPALRARRLGVESLDGTGWMRTTVQRRGLERVLALLAADIHHDPNHLDLFDHAEAA